MKSYRNEKRAPFEKTFKEGYWKTMEVQIINETLAKYYFQEKIFVSTKINCKITRWLNLLNTVTYLHGMGIFTYLWNVTAFFFKLKDLNGYNWYNLNMPGSIEIFLLVELIRYFLFLSLLTH